MEIDFKQLRKLVKEAMFTDGGINEPSYPDGIPIKMPASDTATKEPEQGDPKANKLYELALTARQATEKLVEALDEPIYDDAYEFAFKASASLRKTLNCIEEAGAHPMPSQRMVAPDEKHQKFNASVNRSSGMNYYDADRPRTGMQESMKKNASGGDTYVLERTGVRGHERFFAGAVGAGIYRDRRITYGPFKRAKHFPTTESANVWRQKINRMDGIYTQIQPASIFEDR